MGSGQTAGPVRAVKLCDTAEVKDTSFQVGAPGFKSWLCHFYYLTLGQSIGLQPFPWKWESELTQLDSVGFSEVTFVDAVSLVWSVSEYSNHFPGISEESHQFGVPYLISSLL